jgi:hypothetical protein
MADPVPPREGGLLADVLRAQDDRQRDVERASGTQRANSLRRLQRMIDYLASLVTFAASGDGWNSGSIPLDETIRWNDGNVVEITGLEIPTDRMTVEASVGEASIQPGGDYVTAFISFRVYDVNGALVPVNEGVATRAGRIFTNQRIGMTISTGPRPVTITDRAAHPGPYTVRVQYGAWAASANGTECSIQFNAPSLTVEIIGDGVPEETS